MEFTQEQNWHPITMLPMLARLIDGQLADDREQYDSLSEARPKPHVLNNEIVQRVIEVYTEKKHYLSLYLNQFKKWEKEVLLTASQQKEIERLRDQINLLNIVDSDILNLAVELKEATIEKIMAKSDFEMGIEFLKGFYKPLD